MWYRNRNNRNNKNINSTSEVNKTGYSFIRNTSRILENFYHDNITMRSMESIFIGFIMNESNDWIKRPESHATQI